MKALTSAQCVEWCADTGIKVTPNGGGLIDGVEPRIRSRLNIPNNIGRIYAISRAIEGSIRPWERCLLWVSNFGIWKSSENWHIYYKLRSSLGEFDDINEKPGHLLYEYEAFDVISFIYLSILFGWDLLILTSSDYARFHISHDQWLDVWASDDEQLKEIVDELYKVGLTP